MELSYWQSRWDKGHTGWHMTEVFPLLKQYWHRMDLDEKSTVLVPLCGKSLDLDWLVSRGHYVIGVDLAAKAIKKVMERYDQPFATTRKGGLTRFKNSSIELWHGDFIKLQKAWLPAIEAIYDKAALIALPPDKRIRYSKAITKLASPQTRLFINSLEYKQEEMAGPPFAVFKKELEDHFGHHFNIEELHARSLYDELTKFHQRGLQSFLREKIYLLTPQ